LHGPKKTRVSMNLDTIQKLVNSIVHSTTQQFIQLRGNGIVQHQHQRQHHLEFPFSFSFRRSHDGTEKTI